MFFRNSRKILPAALAILIFSSACRFWQKSENNTANSNTTAATNEPSEDLPFSSKEPEIYQAEIVTRIYTDDEKSERKTLTARSGNKRLTVFDAGEKTEASSLILGESLFLIFKDKKIYAENKLTNSFASQGEDLLTLRLNEKTSAEFENLGAENNLTKFRARLGESENSEILIYVDESLKIPVKQEFYKIEGDRKTLTFSVEVKNFKLSADESLFEPPKDYRRVSPDEFQKMLWREKKNNA